MTTALDTPYGSLQIFLQSADATLSYGDANKVWFLETPIIPDRPNIKMLCAVTDFQCANSWYLIRANQNDRFVFSMTQAGVTTIYTCIIPEKNYNVNTFTSAMNNSIFAASGVPVVVGDLTTLNYDTALNKLTLKNTSATTTNITIFSRDNGTTCNTEVGMNIINDSTIAAASIELPNMVNFGGTPNLYIMAPSLGLQNRDGRGETNLCLCKVPVTTQSGGFVYLPHSGYTFVTLDDREIKRIQIIIEDEEQNILDLHGIDWSLTLSIHFQYQRFNQAEESLTLQTGLVKIGEASPDIEEEVPKQKSTKPVKKR
jgi:hypothetical protein